MRGTYLFCAFYNVIQIHVINYRAHTGGVQGPDLLIILS